MEFKFIYLVIIVAIWLFNYFRKLKEKQREAEKKHPARPGRHTVEPPTAKPQSPRFETLEEILQRAAEEAKQQRQAKRASHPKQPPPTRTWVNEKPKPVVQRSATKPFLTEDNAGYRDPQMEAITTLEESRFGNEGSVAISDVHNPIETVTLEEPTPTINLRQAMLYQVILERPSY
jgi:hypothetical protein